MADMHTIYIKNLNEKVKQQELQKSLLAVFSQFGRIIRIFTSKRLKMRGQAFVVFEKPESAANALQSMNRFPFYEKPLQISYSKIDSDIITKAKGTYIERPRKPRPAISEKKKKDQDPSRMGHPQIPGLIPGVMPGTVVPNMAAYANHPSVAAAMQQHSVPPMDQPPNKILFLINLPPETTEVMLKVLFNQFNGFKEIRLIPGREDIAFVEFENEMCASSAKDALQGFKITPTSALKIAFANK